MRRAAGAAAASLSVAGDSVSSDRGMASFRRALLAGSKVELDAIVSMKVGCGC